MTVRVLHFADAADAAALLAAATLEPTLFVVPEEWVAAMLPLLGSQQDVCVASDSGTLIEHRRQRLAAMAHLEHDGLTGLWARQPFLRRLDQWPPSDADRPVRSLIVIDFDRFKAVNDRLGHTVGDQVLAEAAARVLALTPAAGFAARIGGEEIGILLDDGREPAMALAEQIHQAIRGRPFTQHAVALTASLAVATAGETVNGQALLRQADDAIYAAKAAGRDRVAHASDVLRAALEKDVDPAIQGFENMTRVIADRVADLLSRRGRALFEELQEQAEIDSLTGLYSRRYLDRRLAFEVDERTTEPLSVALVDIDHFGEVNKEHGWPTGDRVLAGVAARIVGCVREGDWVARYGGEEFLVVLPGAALSEAATVLERIRLRVGGRAIDGTEGVSLRVTVSAGVAQHADGEAVGSLKERFSRKLLEAKRGGRNRVVSQS